MCGIVGYVGSKPLLPVLIEGLRRLEYRGYDSAGVAVVRDGAMHIRRSAGKLSQLEEVLKRFPDWTVDTANAVMSPSSTIRGWTSLPVARG